MLTIFSYLQEFLEFSTVKKSTRDCYESILKRFKDWCNENIEDDQITEKDFLDYQYYLETKGLSHLYITNTLCKIRLYIQYLEDKGIQTNPVKNRKIGKNNKNFNKDSLTLEQTKMLLNSIEQNTLKGKRDYAIINLMIRTGLRRCEVRNINIEDIKGEILYVLGKGRNTKDEFVVLTPESEEPIRDYLSCLKKYKEVKDTDPLFLSLGSSANGRKFDRLSLRHLHSIVKERMNFAGIFDDRITPHSLRHTAITLALQAGASINQVQAMA